MNSIDKPDNETLEIILREILEEQQKTNKIIAAQTEPIAALQIKVESFDERLQHFKIIAPPVSTKSFEEIVRKVISESKAASANESKIKTRKIQILLFPEQDAKVFYKIVFGRWLIWLTIMLLITNLYKLSIHWSDSQKEITIRKLETERVKKAWNYMYLQESKSIKRLMDSAYNKSLQLK